MRRFWRGTLLSAAALLLLSMTLALAGCGDGGGGRAEVLAMMEKVPGDFRMCTFMDLGEMRRDSDLEYAYESTAATLNDSEDAGIPTDNVDRMVQAGTLTILGGRFDLPTLEGELAGGGYTRSEHEGTPVWRGPSSSVALVSSSYVVTGWDAGELTDCIDVMNGDGESFCDDADVRGLLDRLPGGFTVMVFAGGEGFEEAYQGVRVTGYSLAKDGSNSARMTVVLAFADAASAGEAEGGVEEMLTYRVGQDGASHVSVTRDGQYVKATGLMSIEAVG